MNGQVLGLVIVASLILPACVGAIGAILDNERVIELSVKTILAAVVFWAVAGLIAAASFLALGRALI